MSWCLIFTYRSYKSFLEAKKKCEILIVSLTKDEFINKGPNRPVFKKKIDKSFCHT